MRTAIREPVLALFLTVLLASCTSKQSIDLTTEADAVASRHRALRAAENRRNLAATMALMAPKVVLYVEGLPASDGVDAARAYWGAFFARPFFDIHERELRSIVVAKSGDIAYDSGIISIRFPLNGRVCEEPGKTLLIWRKIDRIWRVAAYSYNSDLSAGIFSCH